jgi:hypothetical protein
MHAAKDEARAHICRAEARELHDVPYARVLGGIDEGGLGLHHLLVGGRDQQHTIHPREGRCQRLRTQQVTVHNLHRGKRLERACIGSIPHQRPYRITRSNKFTDHGSAGQPARTGDKNRSLSHRYPFHAPAWRCPASPVAASEVVIRRTAPIHRPPPTLPPAPTPPLLRLGCGSVSGGAVRDGPGRTVVPGMARPSASSHFDRGLAGVATQQARLARAGRLDQLGDAGAADLVVSGQRPWGSGLAAHRTGPRPAGVSR